MNKEYGIFSLLQSLSSLNESGQLEQAFHRIRDYFAACADSEMEAKENDPMLWYVLAHKMNDIIAILKDGYSETDLIDAGLIDLKK